MDGCIPACTGTTAGCQPMSEWQQSCFEAGSAERLTAGNGGNSASEQTQRASWLCSRLHALPSRAASAPPVCTYVSVRHLLSEQTENFSECCGGSGVLSWPEGLPQVRVSRRLFSFLSSVFTCQENCEAISERSSASFGSGGLPALASGQEPDGISLPSRARIQHFLRLHLLLL